MPEKRRTLAEVHQQVTQDIRKIARKAKGDAAFRLFVESALGKEPAERIFSGHYR